MCMTEPEVKKIIAFSFLEELKHEFLETYPSNQINNAITYGLRDFDREVHIKMVRIGRGNEKGEVQ